MAKATWLDRAIGWAAPQTAARRVRARASIEAMTRGYAGAALGRNTEGWRVSSTSADAEIERAGRRLRDRARDLVRNNPNAAKAVSVYATDIVGHGISPRPKTSDESLDKRVKDAFAIWAKECDADGQLDFYGMQTLAVRGMIESGEILARRRRRLSTDGLAVPMQIQLIEPDYLDDAIGGVITSGAKSVQGIEFDAIGRRSAYWLYKDHPGNSSTFSLTSARVPASEIAHLYEKQRTQARGASWFAPVIRRIRDVDDYDFAEIIRKKIEASSVAFVTGDDDAEMEIGANGEPAAPRVTDSRGNLVEKFTPGLIGFLRGGKDVRFNQPASIGGYEEYKRVSAREIATGIRMPYEYLTGDLSNVNFSSARVGIVAYRRWCEQVQWQIVIPMLLEPWWKWFCEAAYAAGRIHDPIIPVEWDTPKWQAIEPYKDAMASLIDVRSGFRSWQELVAERGRDPDDVMAEITAFNVAVDENEITLDSDPRKTTMKGLLQKLLPDGSTPDGNSDGLGD